MSYLFAFRRYAPFASFGLGFEGDKRTGASASLGDSARTIGQVSFDRDKVGNLTLSSSGTRYVGVGEWAAEGMGMHKSNIRGSLTSIRKGPNAIAFTAHSAGSNPMVPGA